MPNILAVAQVKAAQLVAENSSPHVSFNQATGILSFSNDRRLKFVPVISDSHEGPYITNTHWIKEIGPANIVVMQHALDTGGADRTFPPTDFTAIIVSLP
jgi:hypothetical protein